MTRTSPPSNVLYDQADTHTFSDWVVPYALGVGAEDLEESHLGGFPDLSSFLVRSEQGFTVDWGELLRLVKRDLTGFGKKLKREIGGKIFIDLGCGIPHRSVVPRLLAQVLGAREYIGVDHSHIQSEQRTHEFPELGAFTSTFVLSDILQFLKTYGRSRSLFFFLAGLEPSKDHPEGLEYLRALTQHVEEVMQEGDSILVGAGTPALDLDRKRFKCLYGDQYQELFRVRSKRWF